MDLSEVQGKLCPQNVILDSDIVTRTGELVPAGTEICVLLCEQLVLCAGDGDYLNVNVLGSTKTTDKHEKIYLNPGNQELFADIHCTGETYKTVDELCREYPRYFSCKNDLFAMDKKDCTVRVNSGEKLEFKTIQCIESSLAAIAKGGQQTYTNVRITTKTSNVVLCSRNGCDIQIPSACKHTFQGLEDPNHYTPRELLQNFPLPRQVKIIDESLNKLGLPYICSNELNLQTVTTNHFLLFTSGFKTGPPVSGFELRHQVKCCELIDPTAVKLRRRIDNSQIGETFSTVFLFEKVQGDQIVFSVIGRKCSTPVSRLKAGRQHYMDMNVSKEKTAAHKMSSSDSGFAEADLESCASTLTIEKGRPSFKQTKLPHSECRTSDRLSTKEEYLNPIDKDNTTSDRSSGEYVDVRLDGEQTPPLPERKYLDLPIEQKDNHTKYDTDQVKPDEGANKKSETNNKEPEKKSDIRQPESDIGSMTMIELENLLKSVKLNKFAEMCCEEQIDGEFFMEMNDEILQEEPFSLRRFDILKVKKLQGGWKPK
ncbi:uncharacterized protein LOC134694298 [Mytilus trossulus]|uniref:uncharacterized protein LOC134694298 n=1 Tax=Mytilus trossulus TaxID=6551 RepID=UPI003007E373